jgi:flagellar basal-body rod protein FlgB
MTTENISLFQAMNAKMHYLTKRQEVISQNIANANTPNFRPSDLTKADFGKVLKNVTRDTLSVTMETTQGNHIPVGGGAADPKAKPQRQTYDVTPDANGVVMEEQLMKSNEVQIDYSMMLNLYRNNVDLIRTATGRNK